ncbi:MAG: cytochrome c biogenesis protein ResB [bacterium]
MGERGRFSGRKMAEGSTPNAIDRIWRFLSSVKLGIVLVTIIIGVAIVGTLITQGEDPDFYIETYGHTWGNLWIRLGFDHFYYTWWWNLLLIFLSINLLVCSINRLGPIWRILTKSPVEVSSDFVRNLQYSESISGIDPGDAGAILRERRYTVRSGPKGLFATKGGWGRWGAHIVHLSIIVILLGGVVDSLTGFRQSVNVMEGETITPPGADFRLRVNDFGIDRLPDGNVKSYRSDVTILDGGRQIDFAIEVNKPLQYKGLTFYQSSYGSVYEADLNINIGGESHTVRAGRGYRGEIPGTGYSLVVGAIVKGFLLDGGRVFDDPNRYNPAAQVMILRGGEEAVEIENAIGSWVFSEEMGPDVSAMRGGPSSPHSPKKDGVTVSVARIHERTYTGLQIARNTGIPFLWIGSGMMMVGLFLSFYVFHRRIWAVSDGDTLLIGGNTNKNRYRFEKEFREIIGRLSNGERRMLK